MNPLQWKREHQIALVCAFVLGAILGWMLGLRLTTAHFAAYLDRWRYVRYWAAVGSWGLFGGAIGAVLVYIRQLLRT
jgi:hypothetical protein